jgi:RNA polymerase sigma-70 factor (sigma-E family)
MTVEPEAAEMCRCLYPSLVGAIGLFCGDRGVAEDLAQEALVRLWERWPTNRRPEHPMAWCYRVAVNLARSAARRRAVEERLLRRVGNEPLDTGRDEPTAQALAVRAAVLELPPRQRQDVVARHYLDLSVKETAQAMGCASGTVTALTSQAVANLRRSERLVGTSWYEEVEHGS